MVVFITLYFLFIFIQVRGMSEKKPYSDKVLIKSRYLSSEEHREIVINPQNQQISISQSNNPKQFKQFHIDQLTSHTQDGNKVSLTFDNGRMYQIQAKKPQQIQQAIKHTRNLQLANKFVQQKIEKPKAVNYSQPLKIIPKNQEHLLQKSSKNNPLKVGQNNGSPGDQVSSLPLEKISSKIREKEKQKENEKRYKKEEYYHRPENWIFHQKEGTLQMMNQEWRGNAGKIFSFVLKKFLSTGSFMGISFPVFAMKPESILQSYAKGVAVAPNTISKSHDPIERFKHFAAFLWLFSHMQVTIVKPFNPVIGETYQADICGGRYSAEQVSHHPPVSAFFYQKDNYKIHAALELSASVGLNSGDGRFIGDITIEYDDGYWVKGKLPNGKLTGVLIGTTTFQTYGGSYMYDSKNCVLTYKMGDNNTFEGNLGILNYKTRKQFQETLKDPQRFISFKPYSKDKYSRVISKFRARYTQWVTFDDKQYVNTKDKVFLPDNHIEPFEFQLPSDSRNRKDIQLLSVKNLQESQEEKERIENEERAFRKLRETHAKKDAKKK